MTKFVCNCLTIFNCICDFVWYTWGYLKTEKMCRNEVFNLSKNVSSIDHRFWIELSVKFVRNSVVWKIWKLKLDKKDCQSFVRLKSSETFKENTDLGIPSFFFFFFVSQPCLKPLHLYIRKFNPNLPKRKTTTQNQEKPLPSIPVLTSQISYP